MSNQTSRRAFVLGGLGVAGCSVTAGCTSWLPSNTADEPSAPNELSRVIVTNESDTDDQFNLSVVRNGEQSYFGQLAVSAGGSKQVDGPWEERGRTFVIVGESKSFCNHEVAALDADSPDDTPHRYDGKFTITESGDVTGGFFSD